MLGYVAVGNRGLILLATRTKAVVNLPGNHTVKLVTGSKWVDLLLEVTTLPKCNGTRATDAQCMALASFRPYMNSVELIANLAVFAFCVGRRYCRLASDKARSGQTIAAARVHP